MATTTVQDERKRINKVIRSTAWAMLIIGILVTASGFAIQVEYSKVHWNSYNFYRDYNCLPRITIPETYEQYWCGFLVVFTSLILLANYKPWPKIEKQLPNLFKKKSFFGIMVLLSMLSGFAVMSQDGETFGRVRRYSHYDNSCSVNHDLDQANMFHLRQILHWLYLILIASNILVVVCLVQLMAFLAIWILEMISNTENPEHQNSVQEQPPPPAYTPEPFPSCSSEQQHHRVPLQAREPQHQFHQQIPLQPSAVPRECGYICPCHAPQPPHCHHCIHSWHPQDNIPITASPQHDTGEECPLPTATND